MRILKKTSFWLLALAAPLIVITWVIASQNLFSTPRLQQANYFWPDFWKDSFFGTLLTMVVFFALRSLWRQEREQASVLRATLESSTDGILVVNSAGKVTCSNQQFAKMWGVPNSLLAAGNDKKMLEMALGQLREPEKFISKVKALYERPAESSFDLVEFKDGRVLERFSNPQRMGDKIVGRVWIFREVIEHGLTTSDSYKSLFDQSPAGFVRMDAAGNILDVNQAITNISGYSREELVGRHVSIFAPQGDTSRVEEHRKKILGGGIHVHEVENVTKGGSTIYVKVVERCLTFQDGHQEILCNVTDVTARKHAERELMASEENYRNLFNSLDVAIYIQDAEGKFITVNQCAEKMYGYPKEFFKGKTPEILAAPGLVDLAATQAAFVKAWNGESQQFYWWGRRANGQTFPKDVRLTRGMYLGQPVIYASSLDITEQRRNEAFIRKQSEILEMIATGKPLADSLAALCRLVETQQENTLASVLLIDVDGRHLRHGAGPGLAEEYIRGIDGIEIGPSVGSCGTAAFTRKPVFVSDIATNPLWKNFATFAEKFSLRACWSTPILDAEGTLLGTFAVYARQVGEPPKALLEVIGMATHTAATAIAKIRAEEQVRYKTQLLNETGALAKVGGWEFDPATGEGNMTDEVYRIHDLEPGAPMNKARGLEYYAGESRKKIESALAAAVQYGTPYDLELEFTSAKGIRKWIRTTCHPVMENGQVIRMRGTFQDITEQKSVADQAARERARFKLIFDTMPIGIAFNTARPDGSIERDVNEAHLRICGITREQSKDPKTYTAITHPDDRERQKRMLAETNADQVQRFSIERRFVQSNGTLTWVSLTFQRQTAPDSTVEELTTVTDITERKLLEEQLRQAQKMEAIGQLSGGIAHDFNNLLTAIIGNATLLTDKDTPPNEVADCAQEIQLAAKRGAELTRQLLLFSRKQTLQPAVVDLNNVVRQSLKMLRRILGEDIAIHTTLAEVAQAVFADAGMIEQVILNLAVNARDAMPQGGLLNINTGIVEIRPPGTSAEVSAKPHVCLAITDHGTGIPPEILPRIFDPFFTTKEVGKGTGLGLATVYGIIQQHNGWITVSSEPGKGTSFQIYLPHFQGSLPTAPVTSSPTVMPRGSGTILLAEDEPPLRTFMTQLLTRLGYEMLVAPNGPEAFALWQQHRDKISLVLTDVIMPGGMSGQDLAAKILAEQPTARVVFTSGYTGEKATIHVPLIEQVNFMRKPFGPGELAEFIQKAMTNEDLPRLPR